MKSKYLLQDIKNEISNLEKLGERNVNQNIVEKIYQQLNLLKQQISQCQKEAIEEDYITLLCDCCPD